jgi:hypothetical protein
VNSVSGKKNILQKGKENNDEGKLRKFVVRNPILKEVLKEIL